MASLVQLSNDHVSHTRPAEKDDLSIVRSRGQVSLRAASILRRSIPQQEACRETRGNALLGFSPRHAYVLSEGYGVKIFSARWKSVHWRTVGCGDIC